MVQDNISIIIPSFNDFSDFKKTFNSIQKQLTSSDEIIIIDSSDDSGRIELYLKNKNFNFKYCIVWIKPNGVYSAMNKGVELSSKNFIQIINSGDILLKGARPLISNAIKENFYKDIFIFEQLSGFEENMPKRIKFTPTKDSLWPHQSIVASKKVYNKIGFYNESYNIVSDQLFFAEARNLFEFMIIKEPLTYYDLKGISSLASLNHSKELFILWKKMDRNLVYCLYKSITPYIKTFLIRVLGLRATQILKNYITGNYSNN